jgi:hypothetical protein
VLGSGDIRCIEFFHCIYCKEVSYDFYVIKLPQHDYACGTHCKRCGTQVFIVDDIERCHTCDLEQRLDCLTAGCTSTLASLRLSYIAQSDKEFKLALKICRMIEISLKIGAP